MNHSKAGALSAHRAAKICTEHRDASGSNAVSAAFVAAVVDKGESSTVQASSVSTQRIPYDEEIDLRSGTRLAAAAFGVADGALTL
jgi:hypothetical protein